MSQILICALVQHKVRSKQNLRNVARNRLIQVQSCKMDQLNLRPTSVKVENNSKKRSAFTERNHLSFDFIVSHKQEEIQLKSLYC